MEKVSIHQPAPYDIIVHWGLLHTCGQVIREYHIEGKIGIITDSNVEKLYLNQVRQAFTEQGIKVESFVIAAGEEHKTFQTLQNILEFLAEKEFVRTDGLLALGGGVVGDITGFAAGCYMRGIPYIQMPTTLLAAIDASVGGKTAVDLKAGKNLAGLFVQPRLVLCDPKCFETLSQEIFQQGMAEAVKTAILSGNELFDIVKEQLVHPLEKESLERLIRACVSYKANVVQQDPFEQGVRKCLNLGHTIGHALEMLSDYKIPHGEAVAYGLQWMIKASQRKGFLKVEEADKMLVLIEQLGFRRRLEYTSEDILKQILHDKKRKQDTITIVFPYGIGDCKLADCTIEQIKELIEIGMDR